MRQKITLMLLLLRCCPTAFSSPAQEQAYAPQQRPNIIFLFSDDQRDNSFGAMGHPYVKTPHFDRLIADGVRFRNTYIAEPTCSPSRAAVFTGTHERVNGVGFTSSYQMTEQQWQYTYPALLRRNGYYTGFIGKFGVEHYTFKGQASEKFDYWRGHDGWAKFFFHTAQNCSAYHDSKTEIITEVTGESMVRFVDSVPPDRPFCLSVSFSVPHGSQAKSMAAFPGPANRIDKLKDHPIYGSLYRDLDIRIPDDTATDPYRFIPRAIMDQDKGRRTKTYAYDYDRASCLEHHVRYHQLITGMDAALGQLLEALGRRQLRRNTVIIFASDHGLLMGEYGMGGKALLYDLTTKIPCFIYDPKLPTAMRGRTLDHLVSSLDLTTTILDYARLDAPEFVEGRSLKPLVYGETPPWRESLFLENLYTGRDTPFSEGIRWRNWKYIRMYDGVARYTEDDVDFRNRKPDFEQLFDLSTDPGERRNLVETHEGSKVLIELRRLCQQHSDDLNNRRARYRQRFTPSTRTGARRNE